MENSKNKKVRVIIASILIVIGIGSLLFWEMWGREYVTYDYIITAAVDIKPGDKISRNVLKEKAFKKDNVISDAIEAKDIPKIVGMISKQNIVKGGQIHLSYLTPPEKFIKEGESIYKLPATWIGSCSSSVRRGDKVEIYGDDGISLGTFKVAFVKDVQEREITSIDNKQQETLDRIESTGVIDNIEIITTLEKYSEIKQRAAYVGELPGEKFTIVQVIR